MCETAESVTPTAPTNPTPTNPTPTTPSNPGDTKNCGDFKTYAEAKAWFDTYYPAYGDIAKLDADGDGEPCETLPGGPGARVSVPRPDAKVLGGTTITLQVTGRGNIPTTRGVGGGVERDVRAPQEHRLGPGGPHPRKRRGVVESEHTPGVTVANLVVVPGQRRRTSRPLLDNWG